MNPAESARKYSSTWDPNHELSMLDSAQAWSAKSNKDGEWMQIDAGQLVTLSGVVTQGRKDTDQWVTQYSVLTSTDGKTWTKAGSFSANTDRNTKVQRELAYPVQARWVRFVAHTWSGHVSMRAGLLTSCGSYTRTLTC